MQVQRAGLAEQPDVLTLLNEYYLANRVLEPDTPAAIELFLTDPAYALWLACIDGRPAGCVLLRPLPSMERALECKRLYVRAQYRGTGLADALLDVMERHALGQGQDWIYLDTNDSMEAALRLYQRRGYLRCERYNANPQATVFLRKAMVR